MTEAELMEKALHDDHSTDDEERALAVLHDGGSEHVSSVDWVEEVTETL